MNSEKNLKKRLERKRNLERLLRKKKDHILIRIISTMETDKITEDPTLMLRKNHLQLNQILDNKIEEIREAVNTTNKELKFKNPTLKDKHCM